MQESRQEKCQPSIFASRNEEMTFFARVLVVLSEQAEPYCMITRTVCSRKGQQDKNGGTGEDQAIMKDNKV